jgi:hypothetical protein
MIAIGKAASKPEWSGVVYLVAVSDIFGMALTWNCTSHGTGNVEQVFNITVCLTYFT